jgi:hypothetical protein
MVTENKQVGTTYQEKMNFNEVKDSGKRQEWETGSKRDTRDGKGRFDLIPPYPLERLARHYENGAKKYGDHNWLLGQPLSRYLDSAMRHMNKVKMGLTDEDHEIAVAWNMFGYIETKRLIDAGQLPKELDDMCFSVEDIKRLLEKKDGLQKQDGNKEVK